MVSGWRKERVGGGEAAYSVCLRIEWERIRTEGGGRDEYYVICSCVQCMGGRWGPGGKLV